MNAKTTFSRHLMVKRRRLFGALLAFFWLAHNAASADEVTLPEQLIGATQGFLEVSVEDYLERSEIQGRHEIQINRLDPRLRLPLCDADLTTALESPAQPMGRVTVRVSCEGSSPWTVFVPAQVRLFRDVVIATRPLRRESVLSAADLSLVERDVGLLGQGYLTSLEQALGNKLTRAVQPDQVLAPLYMQQSEVVRKNDQVVISARNSSINVRMPGEALSDGALGEQIRVRNLGSKRVIRARVIGPGQVEVAM